MDFIEPDGCIKGSALSYITKRVLFGYFRRRNGVVLSGFGIQTSRMPALGWQAVSLISGQLAINHGAVEIQSFHDRRIGKTEQVELAFGL